jgi:hypothetical protein
MGPGPKPQRPKVDSPRRIAMRTTTTTSRLHRACMGGGYRYGPSLTCPDCGFMYAGMGSTVRRCPLCDRVPGFWAWVRSGFKSF